MKRVIEQGNLAFEEQMDICNIYKRWGGEFTENDIRVCKYNKDNKGLQSGLVRNNMQNYKCKYYKRSPKHYTCRLMWKNYTTTSNGKSTKVTFNRGKFYFKGV